MKYNKHIKLKIKVYCGMIAVNKFYCIATKARLHHAVSPTKKNACSPNALSYYCGMNAVEVSEFGQ